MPKVEGLTDKEQALVDNYLSNGFHMGLAAQAAGYNCKDSVQFSKQGSEVLAKRRVSAILDKKKQEIEQECRLSRLDLLEMTAKIAETGSNADKLRAIDLLGKYHNLFTDKQEINITANQPPTEPTERRSWLTSQLELLDQQEQAGLALPAVENNE